MSFVVIRTMLAHSARGPRGNHARSRSLDPRRLLMLMEESDTGHQLAFIPTKSDTIRDAGKLY